MQHQTPDFAPFLYPIMQNPAGLQPALAVVLWTRSIAHPLRPTLAVQVIFSECAQPRPATMEHRVGPPSSMEALPAAIRAHKRAPPKACHAH